MTEPMDDTFMRARDIAFSHGLLSAIEYETEEWLSAAEDAGSDWRGIWHFPIPEDDAAERIAWAAMRRSWMERACAADFSQITHPDKVLGFIEECPGLAEACLNHPRILAEMAPTVTVRGFGGRFENVLQGAFEMDTAHKPSERRWALRSPAFGGRTPYDVMHGFVHGGGRDECFDINSTTIVVWLLSPESAWLPPEVREFLIEGARQYAGWTRDPDAHRLYDLLPDWADFRLEGPSPELVTHLRSVIADACAAVAWTTNPDEVYCEFERRDFLGAWLDPESLVSPNKHLRRKGRSDEEVLRCLAAEALAIGDASHYREALEAIAAVCDRGQGALSEETRSRFNLGPRE